VPQRALQQQQAHEHNACPAQQIASVAIVKHIGLKCIYNII